MKKFFQNIWSKVTKFIQKIYKKADSIADKYCPIAINVVEFIKNLNDTATGDILELLVTKVIPGTADDVAVAALRKKLKTVLPKVLTALQISNAVAQEKDINKQLLAVANAIKMSSDEAQNAAWHSFASLLLSKLSDGELSWSDSVILAEFWFKNVYKKQA